MSGLSCATYDALITRDRKKLTRSGVMVGVVNFKLASVADIFSDGVLTGLPVFHF